jgi:hypothetical protein
MSERYVFGLILAGIWGTGYAVFLQTYPGRFLAARLTWLTVVIGVGVDLAIVLVTLGVSVSVAVAGLIGVSSLPIIGRSLLNEYRDQRDLHHGETRKTGE